MKRLVLAGAGHAHAWVLHALAREPLAELAGPGPAEGRRACSAHPALASNLRVALAGTGDFQPHRPQRHVLTLGATGDGRAIASRGPFGAEGARVWRRKDRIDRRFLNPFRHPAEPQPVSEPVNPACDAPAAFPGDPR